MHADSTLHIDLAAIGRNAARFRGGCGPHRAICGVVKADAYGLGAAVIAPVLEAAHWDMLAVHRIDEALALLDYVHVPLLVLGPVRGLTPLHPLAAALIEGRVHLCVQDEDGLNDARLLGQALGRPIPVHLEVDTGMGRGVPLVTVARTLRGVLGDARLEAAGVMTHFTAASQLPLARRQFEQFDRSMLTIRRRLPVGCKRHAAATTATVLEQALHGDMVRIGLGWVGHALGVDTPAMHNEPLEGAVQWTSRIASIRSVSKGTSLGYGSRFVCPHDMRVAMLPVGYADGLPIQAMGHRFTVLHRNGTCAGQAAVVGVVAMDQVLLDITHLPQTATSIGSTVQLFDGTSLPSFASAMGLQPHHLLTAIGPRVHRRVADQTLARGPQARPAAAG
jgi:alanine racemase